MAKLYSVPIEFDVPVIADDPESARLIAAKHASTELSNLSAWSCAGRPEEIRDKRNIPEEWEDTLPYSDCKGDKLTTAEWMDKIISERRPEDLPGQQVFPGVGEKP